jgi:hypothetical protein
MFFSHLTVNGEPDQRGLPETQSEIVTRMVHGKRNEPGLLGV